MEFIFWIILIFFVLFYGYNIVQLFSHWKKFTKKPVDNRHCPKCKAEYSRFNTPRLERVNMESLNFKVLGCKKCL